MGEKGTGEEGCPVFLLSRPGNPSCEIFQCNVVDHGAVAVLSVFTARCYAERGSIARYCYGKLSVRLSVCLSVTLRQISWLVSLGCSLFATPTSRGYSKGNTPKFSPE